MMLRRSVFGMLVFTFVLSAAACSPLGREEPEDTGTAATVTPESNPSLAPLRIVTPTPVDPRQLPSETDGTPAEVVVPNVYVVQEGDSLYQIAVRFRLNLAEIVELNGLSDPNDISVGQELQLPVPE